MFTFPVVTSASELCFRLLACWLLFAEVIAPCWSLTSASGWNSRTGGYFTLAWPLTVAVDKVRKCHKGANVMGVENSFSASLAQRLPGQRGHVWLPRGARRDDGARGPLWSLSDCEPPSHMGSFCCSKGRDVVLVGGAGRGGKPGPRRAGLEPGPPASVCRMAVLRARLLPAGSTAQPGSAERRSVWRRGDPALV